MIARIQTLNYRCLKNIDQRLSAFNVLVGPNASGKTTFLDVVALLSDLVSDGLEAAIQNRTSNFEDLTWRKSEKGFELAIEAVLPDHIKESLPDRNINGIRYEVAIGLNEEGEISIFSERGVFKKPKAGKNHFPQPSVFPRDPQHPPDTILLPKNRIRRTLFSKKIGGNDNYYSEVSAKRGKGGWQPSFKLGHRKSTFGNLPEDERLFPASTWLKELLSEGVQQFVLNSLLIRKASPPGQTRQFKPDGSNLPWVIWRLREKDPELFSE